MHKTLKQLIPALALLLLVLVFLLLLAVTDTALGIWQKLQDFSPLVWSIYLVVLALAAGISFWLIYRIFRPLSRPESSPPAQKFSQAELESNLEVARAKGADVTAARDELQILNDRSADDRLYIAFFGRVSSGKSSLIQELLPDARIVTDVLAGTTSRITRYEWQTEDSMQLVLADTPGLNDTTPGLGPLAREEAMRAHMVVFVCDGDLTATEHSQLEELLTCEKPVILVLNKTDRYDAYQLDLINRKLDNTYGSRLKLASVAASGRERIVSLDAEGKKSAHWQRRPPQLAGLAKLIQSLGTGQKTHYKTLLESALLGRANEKLEHAIREQRRTLAEKEVASFSKKAVLGALAALTPGSDLVIQAVLATQLIKRLAKIYEVPVKSVEIDDFVRLAGSKIRTHSSIALAVAGNGLKAFPGLGTVAGGLVHAVAYGMIFSGLGKAACRTLESRSTFSARQTAALFEQELTSESPDSLALISKLAVEEFGRHTNMQTKRKKQKARGDS